MSASAGDVELVIDSLAAGGDGVGRTPDGRVVFVPDTAPGDRVRVELVERRRRFAHGRVCELLAPGPDRTEPRCAVFGQCGGCSWQHLHYDAQVAAKRRILRDALERIGRLELEAEVEFVPSPAAYGARGRARVRVEAGRVGFRQAGSHALCAVSHCPVLAPPLERELERLALDPPAHDGEWELTLGAGDVVRRADLAAAGAEPFSVRAGADPLTVSTGVFVQANALLHERLAAEVVAAAGSGGSALELHAGAGFFTLGLARRFEALTAVESDPAAVRDLRQNLANAGLDRVQVVQARAERLPPSALGADVVVLDPPRAGLGEPLATALGRAGAARLVYLSCDPATLARDLRALVATGLHPQRVLGFDLFPPTPHVEALVTLAR